MSKTEGDSSPKHPRSPKVKSHSQSVEKKTAWENLTSCSSRSPTPSPRSKSPIKKSGWEPNTLWNDSYTSDKQSKWGLKTDIKNIIDNLGANKDERGNSCSEDSTEVSSHEELPVKEKTKCKKHRNRELQEPKSKNKFSPKHRKIASKPLPGKETDSQIDSKSAEQNEKPEHIDESEKIGFSDSSSLCILHTCVDDPSILCHCRKKSSTSAPDLEQMSNDNNLRGYETAPNLSAPYIQKESQLKEKDDVRNPVERIFQQRTDFDVCSCQNKKTAIFFMDHVGEHHQELQLPQPGPCQDSSIPANFEDQIRISNHMSQQKVTGKKKISKLKNLIIKRKAITLKKKSNVLHDSFQSKPGMQQNSQWITPYTCGGNWHHNMGSVDHQRIEECHCGVATAERSGNTLPELYAAKIKTAADVPQQFVFNAIGNAVQTTDDNPKNTFDPCNHTCDNKKSFRLYPASKKKQSQKLLTSDQNDERSGRHRNGLWNTCAKNEEFQKELDEFIKLDTQKGNMEKRRQRLSGGADNVDSYTVISPRPERIEVYYFDHGCSGYFRTTDFSPPLMTEMMIEKIDTSVNKFWAEFFGVLHFVTAIIVSFLLQLLRFLLYSLLRPLLIGIIQITSDYFFKPLLAIVFNSILQPIFILFFNVVTSLKDICEVVAQALGYFLQELAHVCRAIRLVDIRNSSKNGQLSTSTSNKPHQMDI